MLSLFEIIRIHAVAARARRGLLGQTPVGMHVLRKGLLVSVPVEMPHQNAHGRAALQVPTVPKVVHPTEQAEQSHVRKARHEGARVQPEKAKAVRVRRLRSDIRHTRRSARSPKYTTPGRPGAYNTRSSDTKVLKRVGHFKSERANGVQVASDLKLFLKLYRLQFV